jgi:bifunctional UDP-N-acetylglucosamine pyrophosphorylase/glucosamine-1-phosphate N-acetyltransferase
MACDAVILAAGLGTRMRSDRPKVLHTLGGIPLLTWTAAASKEAAGRPPVVVVGPGAEADAARDLLGPETPLAVQAERMGTAHALLQAEPCLRGRGELILVVNGDMPLLRGETLRKVAETQARHPGPFTLLVLRSSQARGFGRIVRRQGGAIQEIVEEAVATSAQREIDEINVGVYCFRPEWLWAHLPRVRISPQGERYLTDLVGMAAAEGQTVGSILLEDADEAIGINTREHLAEAEAALRRRVNRRWMLAGVTLRDPATSYIGPLAELGVDTVIEPNTIIEGRTVVGPGCRLGPNSVLRDSVLGGNCVVEASILEGAELEQDVQVGPFSHLRPGARLGRGVHVGNFGEVKNSTLGPGVRMGHFSYIGDATVGADVNIGAGTITCNYDGERKHPTEIGEGAFLGSDTMLVAPVRIGRRARTGAGSVVTRDVPDDSVAVGVPARVIRRKAKDDD